MDWLKCFVATVDAGSLSSAAREVNPSQSAVSMQIKKIATVESGLAVAVLTQCSAPPHFQRLGLEHGLGPLDPMEVAVYRSKASRGSRAVDSFHSLSRPPNRRAA